jgi:hypothetical protein
LIFRQLRNLLCFDFLSYSYTKFRLKVSSLFCSQEFLYEKECSTRFLTFSKLYSPAKGKSRDYFYYDQIPFVLCLCHIWHSCLVIHYHLIRAFFACSFSKASGTQKSFYLGVSTVPDYYVYIPWSGFPNNCPD